MRVADDAMGDGPCFPFALRVCWVSCLALFFFDPDFSHCWPPVHLRRRNVYERAAYIPTPEQLVTFLWWYTQVKFTGLNKSILIPAVHRCVNKVLAHVLFYQAYWEIHSNMHNCRTRTARGVPSAWSCRNKGPPPPSQFTIFNNSNILQPSVRPRAFLARLAFLALPTDVHRVLC